MNLTNLLKLLLSIPKTLFFNFKVFPFKTALKLPVLISYDVKIANVYKNCVVIDSKTSMFMIRINWSSGSQGVNNSYKTNGYFDVKQNGKIIFNGKANFSAGVSIRVDKGYLTIGSNFNCNKHCFFSCSHGITFGDNVLLGWSVEVRDSDGHKIYDLKSNTQTIGYSSVTIGHHVWIGAKVDILKGVGIPDNCVVGYHSVVTKQFVENNCVIAGYPAKVVKQNISWER